MPFRMIILTKGNQFYRRNFNTYDQIEFILKQNDLIEVDGFERGEFFLIPKNNIEHIKIEQFEHER